MREIATHHRQRKQVLDGKNASPGKGNSRHAPNVPGTSVRVSRPHSFHRTRESTGPAASLSGSQTSTEVSDIARWQRHGGSVVLAYQEKAPLTSRGGFPHFAYK